MSSVLIALVAVAIFAIAVVALSRKKGGKATDYPYKKLDVLFSPAERSFLGVLKQVVSSDVEVFGKVRVADVITPKKEMSRSDWQKAFNRIAGKHFDYLLCNKNDLSIICAIELNDSSHNSNIRTERDKFLEGACRSANVPLIKISAKASYSLTEIGNHIDSYLPGRQTQYSSQEPILSSAEQQPAAVDKICPKCSSKMVKKTATKGKNAGNEFWACSAFPKCRYTESKNA